MNKLLVLLFLSFTIACSAWAEKYEYVRIRAGQEPVTLNSGDIAWFVNSSNLYGADIVQYDLDGSELCTQSRVWRYGTNSPRYDTTFVGPCLLGCDDYGFVTIKILRASESGNKTLEWDGEKYAGTTTTGSSDGSQQASNGVNPTSIKYDELLGWAYFTDTNWVYSYTNLSWYYMHPTSEGFYVWNANLPENGWTKLERG
jgi:hypothetical protein